MADYENRNLTNLGQLKKLANRTKTELDALDTRVGTLEQTGAEKNIIVGIQKNGADLTPDGSRKVNIVVPTQTSDLENTSDFQTGTQVTEAVKAALAGALQPKGSIAFASLPALSASVCNFMYNITDKFTTTEDFVEGAGKKYPAGTNVAIVNVADSGEAVYKYDAMPGVIDTSGFMEKIASGSAGKLVKSTEGGGVELTEIDASDVQTAIQSVSGKIDKVEEATEGNIATLTADGGLEDSGKKPADFLTATDIAGKADKPTSATEGHFATFDGNKNLVDAGYALATDADVEAMIAEVFGDEE